MTNIFLVSHILMLFHSPKDLRILRLFRARNSKTVESRFTLKRQNHHRRYSVRKGVFRNFPKFTGKYLCQSLFFKKETVAQVFSCEFSKISKNAFFTEYLLTTASYAYVLLLLKVQSTTDKKNVK